MGQCIIKDCGFDNQKTTLAQKKNLRNFLTEVFHENSDILTISHFQRIKERNNFIPEDLNDAEGTLSTERPNKLRVSTFLGDLKKINKTFQADNFSILGDIKEEEEKEEDEYSGELNEIKSLRTLTEKYDPQFYRKQQLHPMQTIHETGNYCYDSENDEKFNRNQETKLIHNNLRVFLNKEHEILKSNKKNADNNENYLLLSLALTTSNNKPNSANCINPEMFVNENFRKDALNDSFEAIEKFAKIFTDDDYSEEEMQHHFRK